MAPTARNAYQSVFAPGLFQGQVVVVTGGVGQLAVEGLLAGAARKNEDLHAGIAAQSDCIFHA